jgi:nucleoside phosphorylase
MQLTRFTFLTAQEEIYIEHLLLNQDAANREYGLERLCKHYRAERRLRKVPRFIIILLGLLHDPAPSVKRWALNTIALVGSKAQIAAVGQALSANRDDPDVFAAGVAAAASLLNGDEARTFFRSSDIPLEGGALYAAAQQSANFKKELRLARVDIDTAEAKDLRLVGLLIGLGKAPEHFFSLSHRNRDVIGALNFHDDRLVAQYSVWATYENPKLSLRDLKISLNDIDAHRPNIRKYVYRLIASDPKSAVKHFERVVQGSQDGDPVVREGLAAELRDIYFDGLDDVILNWFIVEENEATRHALLEHMAGNMERAPSYKNALFDSYVRANPNSLLRARIETAAQKTQLYRELKLIALEEERDLFEDMDSIDMSTASNSSRSSATNVEGAINKIKVLVVTALAKEQAAMAAVLQERPKTVGKENDPNVYQLGYISDKNDASRKRAVLIASSGMGNQNSSTVATHALRSFPNIEHILMVGIAGGCPSVEKADEHVRLGDIVVSSAGGVIDYGNVKETGEGFEFRGTAQKPSARFVNVQRMLEVNSVLGDKPWLGFAARAIAKLPPSYSRPEINTDVIHVGKTRVTHPNQQNRVQSEPYVHSGVIGSADILQKNAIARDELRDLFKVRAIEMEAAGVQTAAWMAGHDVFVVRGICDYCDEHKNDLWQDYAAAVAAAYARALIEEMPSEWFSA